MKRFLWVILVVLCFVLLVTAPVFADSDQPDTDQEIQVANLFTWATGAEPDWMVGGLYALLGLFGALITVFGLIGGAIPGTAGAARIEANMIRVQKREDRVQQLYEEENPDPDLLKELRIGSNQFRDDVEADRRRQFFSAALLYAILGAFFATMLAQDILQAIVIGAGWTAYLGALGLKRDYAERKEIKDKTSTELEAKLTQIYNKVSGRDDWSDDDLDFDIDQIQVNAEVSRGI